MYMLLKVTIMINYVTTVTDISHSIKLRLVKNNILVYLIFGPVLIRNGRKHRNNFFFLSF